jgi:serine/threonine protein kinase
MRNELEVLEKTDHPHITRVFELLEDKYNFYVVMELLEGGDLLEKVVKIEKFSEDHAVMITH